MKELNSYLTPVVNSDGVSRLGLGLETCLETCSRRVSRPVFLCLGLGLGLERLRSRLGLERFRSRSRVLGLETLRMSYLFESSKSSGF